MLNLNVNVNWLPLKIIYPRLNLAHFVYSARNAAALGLCLGGCNVAGSLSSTPTWVCTIFKHFSKTLYNCNKTIFRRGNIKKSGSFGWWSRQKKCPSPPWMMCLYILKSMGVIHPRKCHFIRVRIGLIEVGEGRGRLIKISISNLINYYLY